MQPGPSKERVKILIDMCLSPEWRFTPETAGFEAVHWSEIGEGNAPDHVLFNWAAARVNWVRRCLSST